MSTDPRWHGILANLTMALVLIGLLVTLHHVLRRRRRARDRLDVTVATPVDRRESLDAPMVLTFGCLPPGTRLRWEGGELAGATLSEALELPEVILPRGATLELDRGSIVAARLPAPLVVSGLEIPADSEIELDPQGRITGVVLGARLADVKGPAGLQWDEGGFVEFEGGAWKLEG